MIDQSIPDQV